MIGNPGYLRLNRLRVMRGGEAVYDQPFHEGVNIIRGQNGSGKSTIADFIFFILGGEFDDWKTAARRCDEVQAEVETPRGKLTLRRQIASSLEPLMVYFGSMKAGAESALEGWERFPIRRQGDRESFSQVMFRSLLIPEAQSEGASNITMHQLLRICYSDQRTPAGRLFRFEMFDTQNIREAVGDLVCGISGYEAYEIGLKLRELEREMEDVRSRLGALHSALPGDQSFNTPGIIQSRIDNLNGERVGIQKEIEQVDQLVNQGDVKEYLEERRLAQERLIAERESLQALEMGEKNIQFELREISEFVNYLDELKKKLSFAEIAHETIGSIEFTHCPVCGVEIAGHTAPGHCVVCKSPLDQERESARFNQIRLDLEIQTRESGQLTDQKRGELENCRRELRGLRREHAKGLSAFSLNYAGANGPREAFLATRIGRLGHIEAEVEFLSRSLDVASEIEGLIARRASLSTEMEALRTRNETLWRETQRRRRRALTQVSDFGAAVLRLDLERQPEFKDADNVSVNFRNDSISVGGLVNFAESSNVLLKNAAILGLFLAAGTDEMFFHPRFILMDNVEDKGMEVERSYKFQRTIVETVTELGLPHQIIFTTSMMNPELELEEYIVGSAYTGENRSLKLGS